MEMYDKFRTMMEQVDDAYGAQENDKRQLQRASLTGRDSDVSSNGDRDSSYHYEPLPRRTALDAGGITGNRAAPSSSSSSHSNNACNHGASSPEAMNAFTAEERYPTTTDSYDDATRYASSGRAATTEGYRVSPTRALSADFPVSNTTPSHVVKEFHDNSSDSTTLTAPTVVVDDVTDSTDCEHLRSIISSQANTILELERARDILRHELSRVNGQREVERDERGRSVARATESANSRVMELQEDNARRRTEVVRLSNKVDTLRHLLEQGGGSDGPSSGGTGSTAVTIADPTASIEDVTAAGAANGAIAPDIESTHMYRNLSRVRWGRKVQRGLTVADTIAIHLGKLWRTDAYLRLFFLVYVAMLHLYTFLISITHAHHQHDIGSDVHDHISNHMTKP